MNLKHQKKSIGSRQNISIGLIGSPVLPDLDNLSEDHELNISKFPKHTFPQGTLSVVDPLEFMSPSDSFYQSNHTAPLQTPQTMAIQAKTLTTKLTRAESFNKRMNKQIENWFYQTTKSYYELEHLWGNKKEFCDFNESNRITVADILEISEKRFSRMVRWCKESIEKQYIEKKQDAYDCLALRKTKQVEKMQNACRQYKDQIKDDNNDIKKKLHVENYVIGKMDGKIENMHNQVNYMENHIKKKDEQIGKMQQKIKVLEEDKYYYQTANTSVGILESKLKKCGDTFFNEISNIMSFYCSSVGVLDCKVRDQREIWDFCMADPKKVHKYNRKFQNIIFSFKNEVDKFDIIKKTINTDNVKGAVVDYNEKKRGLEDELHKK